MDHTHLDSTEQRVLRALFELAQSDQAVDSEALAQAVGSSLPEVTCLLASLDARGLVYAERTRLTLAGLAIAVRIPGRTEARARAYALHEAPREERVVALRRVPDEGDQQR